MAERDSFFKVARRETAGFCCGAAAMDLRGRGGSESDFSVSKSSESLLDVVKSSSDNGGRWRRNVLILMAGGMGKFGMWAKSDFYIPRPTLSVNCRALLGVRWPSGKLSGECSEGGLPNWRDSLRLLHVCDKAIARDCDPVLQLALLVFLLCTNGCFLPSVKDEDFLPACVWKKEK